MSSEDPKKVNKTEKDPTSSDAGMFGGYSSEFDKDSKKTGSLFKDSFNPPIDPTLPPTTEFKKRFIWTVCMISAFMLIIYLGNFYCVLLVFLIVSSIFSELMELSKKNEVSVLSPFLNWYFFVITLYYFSVKILSKQLFALFESFPRLIV